MKLLVSILIVGIAVMGPFGTAVNALSFLASRHQKCADSTPTPAPFQPSLASFDSSSSRRDLLEQFSTAAFAAVLASSALGLQPLPAEASVPLPSAIRNIKGSLRRLRGEDFADDVAFNDYEKLRMNLRNSPFSELRRSCTSVIRAVEEQGSESIVSPEVGSLTDKYRTFIASLEKLDSTASVALRGRVPGPGELQGAYSSAVDALQAFMDAAQQSLALSTDAESRLSESKRVLLP
jgi:hypothetical protein